MAEQDEEDASAKGLRAWLEKQGFPCEMQAARAFRAAGFKVRQSFYFESRKEPVMREGDVLAFLAHDFLRETREGKLKSRRAIASLEMGIVCECKTSTAPWVMFTRVPGEHDDRFGRLERAATAAGNELIHEAFMMMDAALEFDFYKPPTRIGYHVRQSHKEAKEPGSDAAYKAAMQVVDAVLSLLDKPMSTWVVGCSPSRG